VTALLAVDNGTTRKQQVRVYGEALLRSPARSPTLRDSGTILDETPNCPDNDARHPGTRAAGSHGTTIHHQGTPP
jgi:hypothetical protein